MPIALREVAVPSFGVPLDPPRIPASTTKSAAARPMREPACDWLVVYADREHLANIAFLCGYEPRFEEALLLLGPRDRRVLVVGNEGEAYAPLAGLPGLETVLAQSMSLMGQDRSRTPDLAGCAERRRPEARADDRPGRVEVFRAAGMGRAFAWLLRSPLSRRDAGRRSPAERKP